MPPPELSEVKDRIIYLIEGSSYVNDIFFGEGLVSYNDKSSLYGKDEYNSTLEGQDINMYYTEVLPSYTANDGKEIAQFTRIDQIKAEAEKYYSHSYLDGIYQIIFVDDYYSEDGTRAKYIEQSEEKVKLENGKTVTYTEIKLFEYAYHSPKFTAEKPQSIYNYDTMEIVAPSSAEVLIVEIEAYGSYFIPETEETKTGWHTVTLQFVLQDGQWLLDGPSY